MDAKREVVRTGAAGTGGAVGFMFLRDIEGVDPDVKFVGLVVVVAIFLVTLSLSDVFGRRA